MSKEAMKLALEALEWCHGGEPCGTAEAITALREALAEQPAQQEPVASIGYWNQKTGAYYKPDQISASHQKLIEDGILRRCYTAPPQRTWVGLTLEDMETTHWSPDFRAGAKWAAAKLKEKNT